MNYFVLISGLYLLGIMLKVLWIQQTLHLFTVEKKKRKFIVQMWKHFAPEAYSKAFMATSGATKGSRCCVKLTWGSPSRWRAGRLGGHSAAQTLWVPAAHASPADGGEMMEGGVRHKRAGERDIMVHFWSVLL